MVKGSTIQLRAQRFIADNKLDITNARDFFDGSHGSPYDRGSADYYYWRPFDPHKYPNGTYVGDPVTDLTEEELMAYSVGYELELDRKDWGVPMF